MSSNLEPKKYKKPLTKEQGEEEMKEEYECMPIEVIEKTLVEKLNKQFEERFNQLKENLVTLIAQKLSVLIEKNHNLTSTLDNEVEALQQQQNDINQRVEEISRESTSQKKETSVIHGLVKTFNSKLTEVEEKSKQSIQEAQDDIQSIRENICEMVQEVPQITMSSLETRFSNIEARLETSGETIESKNSVNTGLTDDYSPCIHSSKQSFTNISSTNIESHEDFMVEVANEVHDRQKRRKALVIHNVEENDDDAEDNRQVTNILNEIIDDVNLVQQQQLNIYRLGRRSPTKKRTIKVHFKSEDFCTEILNHTKKLRESKLYNHIVFQPDLTPIQRHHLKMLVNEKKRRNCYALQCQEEPDWLIRRGKLCRRRDLSIQNTINVVPS